MPYSFSVVIVLIMWTDESGWINGGRVIHAYDGWMERQRDGWKMNGYLGKWMSAGMERKWSRSVVSDPLWPWTVAYQASPSMGFSRQEYWSGLPFPSPGDLPHQDQDRVSRILGRRFYRLSHQGSRMYGEKMLKGRIIDGGEKIHRRSRCRVCWV